MGLSSFSIPRLLSWLGISFINVYKHNFLVVAKVILLGPLLSAALWFIYKRSSIFFNWHRSSSGCVVGSVTASWVEPNNEALNDSLFVAHWFPKLPKTANSFCLFLGRKEGCQDAKKKRAGCGMRGWCCCVACRVCHCHVLVVHEDTECTHWTGELLQKLVVQPQQTAINRWFLFIFKHASGGGYNIEYAL